MCREERRPSLVGRGGSGNTVPGQRGRERRPESPRVGLRRSASPGRAVAEAGEKAECGQPAHPWCWHRNPTRWASRKESFQGPGPKATSCPCGFRRGCSGNTRPGAADPRPSSLSPDPSALTPPHDALQPPLGHWWRHLPQAVELQLLSATRNLLRPWNLRSGAGPFLLGGEGSAPSADRALWRRHMRQHGRAQAAPGLRLRSVGGLCEQAGAPWRKPKFSVHLGIGKQKDVNTICAIMNLFIYAYI